MHLKEKMLFTQIFYFDKKAISVHIFKRSLMKVGYKRRMDACTLLYEKRKAKTSIFALKGENIEKINGF